MPYLLFSSIYKLSLKVSEFYNMLSDLKFLAKSVVMLTLIIKSEHCIWRSFFTNSKFKRGVPAQSCVDYAPASIKSGPVEIYRESGDLRPS